MPVTTKDKAGLDFMRIVENQFNQAGLSEQEVIRVNNADLSSLIAHFIAHNRLGDEYKNEEVIPLRYYASGYKPKTVAEQVSILKGLFPEMFHFAYEKIAQGNLPEGAEGWFVIPRWQLLGTSYTAAVCNVFIVLQRALYGKFYSYIDNTFELRNLKQSSRSVEIFEKIEILQNKNDLLVVPAQFGFRHRGRSVRRALEVMSGVNIEFGLGVFAVAIMLLTHQDRLSNFLDLAIDCAGDEYTFNQKNGNLYVPEFSFDAGEVQFDCRRPVGEPKGEYGSVSAFLSL